MINNVNKYVLGRTWSKGINNQVWVSPWRCDDEDYAILYIRDNGFTLFCFSGVPASNIYIDKIDFKTVWKKAFKSIEINKLDYVQQCIMLADWLCSLFCK